MKILYKYNKDKRVKKLTRQHLSEDEAGKMKNINI